VDVGAGEKTRSALLVHSGDVNLVSIMVKIGLNGEEGVMKSAEEETHLVSGL